MFNKYIKHHWLAWLPSVLAIAGVLVLILQFSGEPQAQSVPLIVAKTPLVLVLQFSGKPQAQSMPAAVVTKTPVGLSVKKNYRGLPVRLQIPAINVDTAVEYMGNTVNGDMAVPQNSVDVGWYKYGSLPGDAGTAVVAGHVIGLYGQQGVFFHLDELQVGDVLQVIDSKGQIASFTVSQIKTYDQTQQLPQVFNSASGTHLNLITCAGDWDAASRHYLQRLVVFADKSPNNSASTSE